ncbi:MAG: hypothetical protein GY820_10770, partial [Gammaproteobacteria bacterium]|nr:hypothetical protein [Gammaproteobacteria bacterium]
MSTTRIPTSQQIHEMFASFEAWRSTNMSPKIAQKEPVRKIPVKNDPLSTPLPNSEVWRSTNLSPKSAQEPVGKIPVINDPPSKSLPDIQRYAKKVSDQAPPQSSAKIQYGASPPEHRGRKSPYMPYRPPQDPPYMPYRPPQNPPYMPYRPPQNSPYVPYRPP